MTPFQRINLGIGLAALGLLVCLAVGGAPAKPDPQDGNAAVFGLRLR